MLHAYGVEVKGRHVVIVGRGLTIGRPLANLLALNFPDANTAVTRCVFHAKETRSTVEYTRQADIIVGSRWCPGAYDADMVRPAQRWWFGQLTLMTNGEAALAI